MPRDLAPGRSGVALQSAAAFEPATKAAVAELFKENGGHRCAIDRFGVSLRRAYLFTEIGSGDDISFRRVAMLTSAKATAGARYLATLAGGFFCPVASVADSPAMRLTAESVREHGEAIATTISALADGKVTPREQAAVVREIDDAIRALASLRGAVVAMASAREVAR